jgi:hypothetical protein
MAEWQNEDDIKAELRTLTKELRQLREELRGMVSPRKPNPARTLLHRQSWPPSAADAPPAEAADSQRVPSKKREKK